MAWHSEQQRLAVGFADKQIVLWELGSLFPPSVKAITPSTRPTMTYFEQKDSALAQQLREHQNNRAENPLVAENFIALNLYSHLKQIIWHPNTSHLFYLSFGSILKASVNHPHNVHNQDIPHNVEKILFFDGSARLYYSGADPGIYGFNLDTREKHDIYTARRERPSYLQSEEGKRWTAGKKAESDRFKQDVYHFYDCLKQTYDELIQAGKPVPPKLLQYIPLEKLSRTIKGAHIHFPDDLYGISRGNLKARLLTIGFTEDMADLLLRHGFQKLVEASFCGALINNMDDLFGPTINENIFFHPPSSRFAIADNFFLSWLDDAEHPIPAERLQVLDTDKRLQRVRELVFTSDGQQLIVAAPFTAEPHQLSRWRIPDGFVAAFELTEPVDRLALSPDDRFLLASFEHRLWLFDVTGRQLLAHFETDSRVVQLLFVDHDRWISLHFNGTLKLWSRAQALDTGSWSLTLWADAAGRTLMLLPDGTFAASSRETLAHYAPAIWAELHDQVDEAGIRDFLKRRHRAEALEAAYRNWAAVSDPKFPEENLSKM